MGIEEDVIVVEAAHVGLAVHVPVSLLSELPGLGQEVTVYTHFQVREDAMTLYGFLRSQDRDMFRQLLGVNGIGPKGALGILSALSPDDVRIAIAGEDVKALAKAPGIGTKTAQRMILDLKDKISIEGVPGGMAAAPGLGQASAGMAGMAEAAREAVEALVSLGYTGAEASRAVRQVESQEGMTSEEVLKASLKHLAFL